MAALLEVPVVIEYAVARYVDDLARNEPVNVGVIAYDGTRAVARFDGEGAPGHIDMRRVRHRITGSQTYQAWVRYWRRALDDPQALTAELDGVPAGDPRGIEYLLALGGDEFSLNRGGKILFDADERDLDATLDALFKRLVRAEEPAAPLSLADRSRESLGGAGVPLDDAKRFKEGASLKLSVGGQEFSESVSYAVLNGTWHYIATAPFDPHRIRSSFKEARSVSFLFEHAKLDHRGIVLYDGRDLVGKTRPLLGMIEQFATVVDVSKPTIAAPLLRDALSLS